MIWYQQVLEFFEYVNLIEFAALVGLLGVLLAFLLSVIERRRARAESLRSFAPDPVDRAE